MRVVLVGVGAVGRRVAHQLVATAEVSALELVDPDTGAARRVAASLGTRAAVSASLGPLLPPAVVVLACPGPHAGIAAPLVRAGIHVVSPAADLDDIDALLTLDGAARAGGATLVVGAGCSPGLSCVLAVHGAAELDRVDEIHVASSSTGGPACAAEHARLLRRPSEEWDGGRWERRRGGRELVWFPDPIGGLDCYRAARGEPRLLQRAFPDAQRITTRVSGRRVDRLTHRIPLLRPPRAEGAPGGLRVELRGRVAGMPGTVVFGVMDRPATVAAAVAGEVTAALARGGGPPGALGVAEFVPDTAAFLARLADLGVKAARFVGLSD